MAKMRDIAIFEVITMKAYLTNTDLLFGKKHCFQAGDAYLLKRHSH